MVTEDLLKEYTEAMADLTSWWAFLKQHDKIIGNLLVALLVFLAGWQLGRVTAPYYTAHPIIFQETTCTEEYCPPSSGGTTGELEALKAAGEAQSAPSTSSQVAGTQASNTQAEYIASQNSDLFHHTSCSSAKRIKPENILTFATPQEAQLAGFSPSTCAQKFLANQ